MDRVTLLRKAGKSRVAAFYERVELVRVTDQEMVVGVPQPDLECNVPPRVSTKVERIPLGEIVWSQTWKDTSFR